MFTQSHVLSSLQSELISINAQKREQIIIQVYPFAKQDQSFADTFLWPKLASGKVLNQTKIPFQAGECVYR